MCEFKEQLQEGLNGIHLDEECRNKILNNNSIYVRRNRIKRVSAWMPRIAAVCLTIILISSGVAYAMTGKTIWDVFFEEDNIELARQLYDKNGQSYTIDDYTITLEETIFDSRANMGYVMFSYNRENAKPEAISNGVDRRFYFYIPSTGGVSREFTYEGDTLYEFIEFTVEDDYERNIIIYDLSDVNGKTQSGYKEYPFTIKETSKTKTFLYSKETECVISPIGIYVKSDVDMKKMQITVVDKEDNRQEVIANYDDLTGSSFTEETKDEKVVTSYSYDKVFKDLMDVDNIAYLEFNGKEVYEIK